MAISSYSAIFIPAKEERSSVTVKLLVPKHDTTTPLKDKSNADDTSSYIFAFWEFGSKIRLAEKEESSDSQLLIERVV